MPDFGPSWNVAPQTFQLVVRLNRDTGEREIVLMRWGLTPYLETVVEFRTSLHNLPQTPVFAGLGAGKDDQFITAPIIVDCLAIYL
jgi:putative SOS response-associated peptidase YedK